MDKRIRNSNGNLATASAQDLLPTSKQLLDEYNALVQALAQCRQRIMALSAVERCKLLSLLSS